MTTPAPAPAPGPRPERKPWPLRWIVLTILVVIVPYTYVNLKFRKPNKAFEPYADMMAQANVNRLLDAGFRRVSLPVAPAPSNGGETLVAPAIERGTGGLPTELGEALVAAPRLPAAYGELVAAATPVASQSPLMLRFTLSTDANHEAPAFYPTGVELYLRDREVVLVPVPAPEGPRTESAPHGFQVCLPARLLSSGEYAFHLAGARESLRWTLLVR